MNMEPSPAPAPPVLKKTRFSRLEKIFFVVGPLGFLGIILFFTLFRTYHIPSGAMEPTILVGDIVVFRSPEDPKVELMKRVVGLPGDTIQILNKTLRINGKTAEEPYAVHLDSAIQVMDDQMLAKRDYFGPLVIPPDHYFMMGDNRDNSYDSRFYGPVPRENLRGGGFLWVYGSNDSDRIGRRLR
jgi:signal peptidase I